MHELLADPRIAELLLQQGRDTVLNWARDAIDELRGELLNNGEIADRETLTAQLAAALQSRGLQRNSNRLARVVNATGVILHTGLGRAPLSCEAVQATSECAAASNLEVDLSTGTRRYRGYQLQEALEQLTGAEHSVIVNNNAAATLLSLQALCRGHEVIISRGQLIEIGGSFRLPEIFKLSGAVLREVGTTNRTRLADYREAIGPDTAAILHVHPSNYRVMGFAETPGIDALASLAHEHGLVAIDDIGSGAMLDLTRYGLPREPTFSESIAAGADVVLGSGDKLLGGPQCGIIVGRRDFIERIRQHPLARAVRVDKLTLAALSATLDAYLRGTAKDQIPTLSLLATPVEELRRRAESLAESLESKPQFTVTVIEATAPVGGGSLPLAELPTAVLQITHSDRSAEELASQLRQTPPRVFGRIQDGQLWLDLRSVSPDDDAVIREALLQESDVHGQ